MSEVFIRGTGRTKFGVLLDRSIKQLTAEAIELALKDADVARSEIDGIFFGNCLQGAIENLHSTRGPIACLPAGFGRIPIHSIEGACATGADALHLGYLGVASGMHETVLVVGAEKVNLPDRRKTFEAFGNNFDPDENIEELFEVSAGSGETRTIAVDRHAVLARQLMAETDLTVQDFATLAAAGYAGARVNPYAHRTHGATAEQILAATTTVAPLTKLMMCPISDGGAAVVISSKPDRGTRNVRIAATRIATRSHLDDPDGPSAAATAAAGAFEAAGLGPEDIDVAELHDASVPYLLMSLRDTGIFPPGTEARHIREGRNALGGALPVNTSGGLLCRGHAIGATGISQVAELTEQLRGEAGAVQVEGARTALAHVGGGVVRFKTAVAAATILVKA